MAATEPIRFPIITFASANKSVFEHKLKNYQVLDFPPALTLFEDFAPVFFIDVIIKYIDIYPI